MRCFAMVVLLATGLLAIGIWVLASTPARANSRARIGVDPVIDLGSFDPWRQEPIHAQTAIRNSGTAPLAITQLRLSCNCVSARLESEVIPAGSAGKLFVTLRPGNRNGLTSARLALYSNDPENPAANLVIRWECVFPYRCQPDPIRLLPPKDSAKPWTASARVVPQAGAAKLPRLQGVSASPEWINARLESASRQDDPIMIQLAAWDRDIPAEPSGTGQVRVAFAGDHGVLTIPVEWRRPDFLVVEPSSSFAGIVRPGAKISKRFWVCFNDGRPFALLDFASPDVALTLPVSWPRTGAVVTATLTAPATQGTFERSFELASAGANPARRRVKIHGIVE